MFPLNLSFFLFLYCESNDIVESSIRGSRERARRGGEVLNEMVKVAL